MAAWVVVMVYANADISIDLPCHMLLFPFRGPGWHKWMKRDAPGNRRAKVVLDRRLARGEIGREGYQRAKKDLE